MNRLEEMKTMWNRYINYYVISNRELKDMAFLNTTGAILTMKGCGFIESAREISTRYHIFAFQDSGTGKSEVMKSADRLLQGIGIPSKYTTYDNEARCIGKIEYDRTKNKYKPTFGALAYTFGYYWDEGHFLLYPPKYLQNIHEDLMCVMDEPGWVSKGMRDGDITYPSKASIMSGTFEVPKMENMFLKKGFLQRMAISYKVFNHDERATIRRGINLLKLNVDYSKIKEMFDFYKDICNTLPTNRWLKFNEEAVKEAGILSEEVFRDFIEGSFTDTPQKILETFYNRFYLLVDKVACQIALVNDGSEITIDDIKYSLNKNRWHLESLLRIFEYLKGNTELTAPEKRKRNIINIIDENNGAMERDELLAKLLEFYRVGKWDIGIKRTVTLIEEMVSSGNLHAEKSQENKKIIIRS